MDNREIVEQLYESFKRRDDEKTFAYLDEDVEFHTEKTGLLGLDGVHRGHDGVRRFWREWLAAWSEIDWTVQEMTELPDGRIKAVVHQRNKGRDSEIWVDQRPYEQIWTLRDGKVVRIDIEWVERD